MQEDFEDIYSTEKEKKYNMQQTEIAHDLKIEAGKIVKVVAAMLALLLLVSFYTLRDSFACYGLTPDVCIAIRSQLACKA